jgi:hypothetical protein
VQNLNILLNRAARRLAVALTAALLGACAGNGQGLDANGNPIGGGGNPAGPLTADFKSIQDNVFTPICVRCHSGASAPEGLQLDEAHSYALLVGVPSVESPSLDRVNAGNPDASYLVMKIEGAAGIVGARMPFGGPYLPQSTIDVIRQWISDGAQPAASATAMASAFAVAAVSPPDGALVHAGQRPVVVAFNHEPDASLLSQSTVHLERVTDQGVQELPGEVALRLAQGNRAAVLLTARQGLQPGRYRLTVSATDGGLADVNAQPLAEGSVSEFTVEDAQ